MKYIQGDTYLVFTGDVYYPSQGAEDIALSTQDIQTLEDFVYDWETDDEKMEDWIQIYHVESGEIVYYQNYFPFAN